MVAFLFAVHAVTEASNKQGGARAVDLPARSFDQARPGVASPLEPVNFSWKKFTN